MIERVLVANRGEIARRVMRSCHAMGIDTVAVYSDPDRDAPHVGDSDVAVALGGEAARDSYLDMAKVLDAAQRTGADAIHPGYGFLAENPDFADACVARGLTWIGPPPAAMRAMALKIEAKELVRAAGVPILPSLPIDSDDADAFVRAADEIGYPLLVKASAGGGGKGMRRVDDAGALSDAVRGGQREAQSSFGDGTVFLERLLVSPRHVEVQVLADQHGNVVHLFERDCSVQRRHQKVVEEAPAPGLSPGVRAGLHDAAVAIARTIGYTSAGTVEFLVAGDEFFFLEMNTRLQVEHPVTEEICGLDLVRLQIEIAEGHPLPFTQDEVHTQGHAIEVRLYAEDPRNDFLPAPGRIERFAPAPTPGIRWEVGVASGGDVTPLYDPMLAKVIAHAATREEAARRLARALRQTQVLGVTTNRDSLVATLEHPAFLAGGVSTDFYDEYGDVLLAAPPASVRERHGVAAALTQREHERIALARSLPLVAGAGWRNTSAPPPVVEFDGDEPLTVACPPPDWRVLDLNEHAVVAEIDGERHAYSVHHAGPVHWVSGDGWQSELVERDRFPTHGTEAAAHGPSAPMPGTMVTVEVQVGDHVEAGALLAVLEAMKMEHRLLADVAGTVTAVHVAAGDRVDAHQLLITIEPDSI